MINRCPHAVHAIDIVIIATLRRLSFTPRDIERADMVAHITLDVDTTPDVYLISPSRCRRRHVAVHFDYVAIRYNIIVGDAGRD